MAADATVMAGGSQPQPQAQPQAPPRPQQPAAPEKAAKAAKAESEEEFEDDSEEEVIPAKTSRGGRGRATKKDVKYAGDDGDGWDDDDSD